MKLTWYTERYSAHMCKRSTPTAIIYININSEYDELTTIESTNTDTRTLRFVCMCACANSGMWTGITIKCVIFFAYFAQCKVHGFGYVCSRRTLTNTHYTIRSFLLFWTIGMSVRWSPLGWCCKLYIIIEINISQYHVVRENTSRLPVISRRMGLWRSDAWHCCVLLILMALIVW